MNFPEYFLFLGYPVEQAIFDSIDPSLKKIYIKEGEEYLVEVLHEGTIYLGKWIGKSGEMAKLSLLEENVYSLLAKLFPGGRVRDIPLQIIAAEGRPCS